MSVADVLRFPGGGPWRRGAWRWAHQVGKRWRSWESETQKRPYRSREFRKLLDEGVAGDNGGVSAGDQRRRLSGAVLPSREYHAAHAVRGEGCDEEEGGRHTPFFNGYRPQFYFRTTDVTGTVDLQEGTEMVMPGDNTQMTVNLLTPIAMDEGLRFAIREGGRTVGAGVVTKILE